MSEDDKESKTEEPTEKRQADFEEEGKVAYSRELPVATSLLVLAAYISFFSASDASHLASMLSAATIQMAGSNLASADVAVYATSLTKAVGLVCLPFLVAAMVASLAAAIQNRPRAVLKRISPEWSRISPLAGFKRLFSANNLFEFAKSLTKIALGTAVVVYAMQDTFSSFGSMAQMAGLESARKIIPSAMTTIWALFTVAAIVAAADFAWQRHTWFSSLRMTRQELKDEFRQSDGDPIVKSRMRAIARDKSRKRMMQAVPSATLIVANPTHISVALRYDPEKDAAPLVVAMGADMIAQRIREIGAQHGVPVFERVDLARALYRSVKVNQIIPVKFYAALAELIRLINARSREKRSNRI